MKIGDPRQFELRPASLDDTVFAALRTQYYPPLQLLGKELRVALKPDIEIELGRKIPTGNFSIRHDRGFFITGSGVEKRKLSPDGVLYVERVDYEHNLFYCKGDVRPSRETLIHDQIYQAFPHIKVIAHTHDTLALKYGSFAATEHSIFFANHEEALEVVRSLQGKSYVTLPKHGQFIIGESIDKVIGEFREHHSQARWNSPWFQSMAAISFVGIGYTSLLLIAALTSGIPERFQGCQKIIGTERAYEAVHWVCPTARDCGELEEWKGERQSFTQDRRFECVYMVVQYGTP